VFKVLRNVCPGLGEQFFVWLFNGCISVFYVLYFCFIVGSLDCSFSYSYDSNMGRLVVGCFVFFGLGVLVVDISNWDSIFFGIFFMVLLAD